MCVIVSREQVEVRSTRIFARALEERQLLVYQMYLDTREPAAMILPIPIAPGAGEDAVEFRDLSRLPHLFDSMKGGFEPLMRAPERAAGLSAPRLAVHQVGSFVASFVPTRAEFVRLDPQFRLPDEVWSQLPPYDDWGFVVFQLGAGKQTVHPMAFAFPSRFPDWLYFPTVHVHDGQVHAAAGFDHELYFQGLTRVCYRERWFGTGLPGFREPRYRGEVSHQRAGEFMPFEAIHGGVVERETPLLRLVLQGELPNEDTWLRDSPLE